MGSITDWLTKEGFKENQNTGVFERGQAVIDFGALAGHTLDSFKKLAKQKGWLDASDSKFSGIDWSGYPEGYAPGIFLGVSVYTIDRKGPVNDILIEPLHDPNYKRILIADIGSNILCIFATTVAWKMSAYFLSDQLEGGNILDFCNFPQVRVEAGYWVKLEGILSLYERATVNSNQLLILLERQKKWSEPTFGPGPKTQARIDHIKKELREIEESPEDPIEYIDGIILTLDAMWRTGCTFAYIITCLENDSDEMNITELLSRVQKVKNVANCVPAAYWGVVGVYFLQELRKLYTDDEIFWMVYAKQIVNFHRKWPDPVDEDVIIEHIRENI